ncbi:dinitrogenase iron-molybdenum cofactor biosynthesis protein [candidate division KSB3 bacterium]|uniref:Dinitrogenase iron-molybdenum cofactor biosynthesis protein n=1 Tax=candidate division KSB3 bacterium TaxID=2044937 RepID=A0A2G6K6I2_9BACT|nr:MAG: dinitrogenase iron-molybdenum cofactor biosynthesis protein [candidate division KSB3 bacterium]
MKICIPVLDLNGLKSKISQHFGKAATFAIVDDETMEVTALTNDGQHHGGVLAPPDIIEQAGVDVVLCGGLGIKAVRMFEEKGIHVYNNASGTVEDVVKAYKEGLLPEATDANACQEHAH